MNSPGVYRFTSLNLADAAIAQAKKLKLDGHAIAVEELYESDKTFVWVTVLHYKSCRRCQDDKNSDRTDHRKADQ